MPGTSKSCTWKELKNCRSLMFFPKNDSSKSLFLVLVANYFNSKYVSGKNRLG